MMILPNLRCCSRRTNSSFSDFTGFARVHVAGNSERAARDFPFKLVETTGERALATWAELKARGDGAPIVLGGPGDLYRIANRMAFMRERGDTPAAVLGAADQVRFPHDLLAERAEEYVQAADFWRRERE